MSSGVAMLPLTPPIEPFESFDAFAEAIDSENGVTLTGSNHYTVQQQSSIATPISNINMGLDSMDDRSEMGERSDSQDLSDEDQDMSDGGAELSNGAPLTMTVSHAEELNAEMDMLDAEIMGHDNVNVLLHNGHYQSTMGNDIPFYYSEPFHGHEQPAHLSEDDFYGMMDDVLTLGVAPAPDPPATISGLPVVMSELSQQLQHIQDGQEHADLTSVQDAQTGTLDNSISPLPFLSLSSFVGTGSSLNLPSEDSSPGYQQILYPLELAGATPSPAEDGLVISQTHQISHSENALLVSYLPPSDTNWDDDFLASETDQIEVEDQFNLSLGDFLYTWGRTMSREEEPRRRTRGPVLPAVSRQRDLKDLDPIELCDLQGDKCDIQRIDWKELGITRLEAREMRRQTYKNYTNLRASHRLHVSIILGSFLS
jgi:hypothetical protein